MKDITLMPHQQKPLEAADNKAKGIILRWARQTGKDVLIRHACGPDDLVVYPTSMNLYINREWAIEKNHYSVFRFNKMLDFWYEKPLEARKIRKPKRVFLNECAYYDEVTLMGKNNLLAKIRKIWPKTQIWMISTPRPGDRAPQAGKDFEKMTEALERFVPPGFYYSRVSNAEGPNPTGRAARKMMYKHSPDMVKSEMDAEFVKTS